MTYANLAAAALLSTALVVFPAAGFAQSSGSTTQSAPKAKSASSTKDFVTKAAIGDMFEVQSSQLALQKSQNQQIKDFAQHMVNDHSQTTDKLKQTVQSANAGVTIPTALDSKHSKMLDKLNSASGADFDKAYLRDQVAGHKDALNLMRSYGQNGDNPQLKQLAQQTAPKISEHLNEVQKLSSGTRMSGNADHSGMSSQRTSGSGANDRQNAGAMPTPMGDTTGNRR
jgi:putative membrane protein